MFVLIAMAPPMVDFPEAFGPKTNMHYGRQAVLD
jgi:hypothetical protein